MVFAWIRYFRLLIPFHPFFGNRGPGRIPLDWTTRISLVLGAARGLACVHAEYSSTKISHGNVKSTNVLLDKNGVACIADFGVSLLLNPVHAIARLGGYKAPEQSETKRLSQQADVYSYGVLLLEVLTAKPPTQFPSPSRPKNQEEELSTDLPKWVKPVVRDEWTAEVFDPELLKVQEHRKGARGNATRSNVLRCGTTREKANNDGSNEDDRGD